MEKIKIKDIGERGLTVRDTISEELFGLTNEDYLWLIEPVQVEIKLKRFDATVLGDVQVSTCYQSSCSRTLEDVRREWKDSFELDYEVEREQEFLDMEDDIRQEIIIRLPTKVLSDAELKKEQENLGLEEEEVPPANTYRPFAGLKDLEA
ncbi:MAG: hypothetical protein KC900_13075 [Candidatus Omnitrophica bacterium]|nr:hypothetical protein [Candidatus Omnitrophota bacterium]